MSMTLVSQKQLVNVAKAICNPLLMILTNGVQRMI